MNFIELIKTQINRKTTSEPSNPPRRNARTGIERITAASGRGCFRFSSDAQTVVATGRHNSGIAVDGWIDVFVQGGVETSRGVLAAHAF